MVSFFLSVPATSANLGPGFDTLGLALDLRMTVHAQPAQDWSIQYVGEGAEGMPSGKENLIAKAYAKGCHQLGQAEQAFHLAIENPVPISRGMGSSATAIVAGLALAQLAGSGQVDRELLFQQAAQYEGHPDNVAAAIFGGLQVCASGEGRFSAETAPIDPAIQVLFLTPEVGFSTKEMRGILPKSYDEETIAANTSAQARLLVGLRTGDPEGLRCSEEDRFHQPYRLAAQPISLALFEILQAEPLVAGAFLSGSGPTIAGWVLAGKNPEATVKAALDGRQLQTRIQRLAVDHQGLVWWQGPSPD